MGQLNQPASLEKQNRRFTEDAKAAISTAEMALRAVLIPYK
jgi:hypothetical protein